MKAAIMYIPLALLACLLTVACESGGGSGAADTGAYLVGQWSGMYQEDGGSSYDFRVSIFSQSGNRFNGTLLESPVGESELFGTVDEQGNINITSPSGFTMEGWLEGDNDMSGHYKTASGHIGYWELYRK